MNCPNWSDCCKNCSSCSDNCCRKCLSYSDGDAPYELIIIQEEENVVNQILKERAKEALKQKVEEIVEKDKTNNYMNCYDAAQQVIDQEWPEANKDPGADVTAPPADQASSENGDQSKASSPDQSSGSKKDNKAETRSPEKKAPSTSGDQSTAPPADQASRAGDTAPPANQPSASEKVNENVSVTRSPGKKEKKDETSIEEQEMNRLMEDQGATGSS